MRLIALLELPPGEGWRDTESGTKYNPTRQSMQHAT